MLDLSLPLQPCLFCIKTMTAAVPYARKSRSRFHQITPFEICFTLSHIPFSAIHKEPSQKKDRKYAKKFSLKARNASNVGSLGLASSNTSIVIMIVRTASVNATSLSHTLITCFLFSFSGQKQCFLYPISCLCCKHHYRCIIQKEKNL